MSSEPQLTFAIPFYRNAGYLKRAIDSVLRQSIDNWRVIVCDDAGPEADVADMVRSYDDERISYTRNAVNLGLAGNWNRCLELATTDFVTLLHADDELLPGYADTVTRALDEFPNAVAVYPRAVVIDATGRNIFSAPDVAKRFIEQRSQRVVVEGEEGLNRLMRGQTMFCPALCYRRSRLAASPFSTRWEMVLDLSLLSEFLFDGEQLVGLREVAYAYRRHAASQSAELTGNTQRFVEELALFDEIAAKAEARGWVRAARTARRKRIVRLHLVYRATLELMHGRRTAASSYIALLKRR